MYVIIWLPQLNVRFRDSWAKGYEGGPLLENLVFNPELFASDVDW
jgi:hypothetical protein